MLVSTVTSVWFLVASYDTLPENGVVILQNRERYTRVFESYKQSKLLSDVDRSGGPDRWTRDYSNIAVDVIDHSKQSRKGR